MSDEETSEGLDAARALVRQARSLVALGELEYAIAMFSEVAERYRDASEPGVRELVTMALGVKADVLGMVGRRAEAIVVSDALVVSTGDDETDPLQLLLLSGALGTNGTALIGEERYLEAIDVLDELVLRFGDSEVPELRGAVALAISNQSVALARLGLQGQALMAHDDMVESYGEEALIVFQGLAGRYAKEAGPRARELVVGALYNKAWVLGDLGRQEEATGVLSELITRFGDDENVNVQVVVEGARGMLKEMSEDSG